MAISERQLNYCSPNKSI